MLIGVRNNGRVSDIIVILERICNKPGKLG